MTDETIESGNRSARKAVEEAGFSDELKRQLEERLSGASPRSQNQQAFSEVDMPSSAGAGTRSTATAQPWTGSESLQDSALRMLDDSHKKIRAPRVPISVNLRPTPKAKPTSTGSRLATARDRTSIYALSQQQGMTEKEREQMRKELKDRFSPGARPMPTSLQGLTSLANERIEDAISRGQFKNLPRGKGKHTERDYNANSPFLDTTEYFMNKIIQKQEIVPPWIEKQQELVKSVETFRKRLRNDWRRHAARTIASQGGSLEAQVRRATAYALAEELVNPKATKSEQLSQIDESGNLSTVVVEEKAAPIEDEVLANANAIENPSPPSVTLSVTEHEASASASTTPTPPPPSPPSPPAPSHEAPLSDLQPSSHPVPEDPSPPSAILPAAYPFRDPTWLLTESSYHTLAISSLNAQTRSYNLQAPAIAQKPYFTLARELNRCYADVARELPAAIRERAAGGKVRVEGAGRTREGEGMIGRFGAGHRARVYDEDLGRKGYGLRELWRDFWGGGGNP
ncbi:MAG: hypothetical protein Q9160_008905 [Pyrenula sp. 1 TL-2023]